MFPYHTFDISFDRSATLYNVYSTIIFSLRRIQKRNTQRDEIMYSMCRGHMYTPMDTCINVYDRLYSAPLYLHHIEKRQMVP